MKKSILFLLNCILFTSCILSDGEKTQSKVEIPGATSVAVPSEYAGDTSSESGSMTQGRSQERLPPQ